MDGMQYSIQNISTGQQDLYFNRRPVSFIWEVPHFVANCMCSGTVEPR